MEAENGEAGVTAAARHDGKIDLVITDVVMPGMGAANWSSNSRSRAQKPRCFTSPDIPRTQLSVKAPSRAAQHFAEAFHPAKSVAKVREVLGQSVPC